MNKKYILYNLQEAKEQLDSIIKDIKEDPSYDTGEYITDITHLYHHINTAWNSRESSEEESNICTHENFLGGGNFLKISTLENRREGQEKHLINFPECPLCILTEQK